ncbi:MAG: glycosyltransferase family 2 protein [Chloroflexi bacterium]|nr:glycosyltransferase family 2 protein [Chloroflexota bacterium]MCL5950311.1 glycosyltransferase family 2 protein [Chloroflexota bacterium]
MYKNHRISLVMPCYNEERGLREVYRDLPACVDEVIVADNNSSDCTAAVARELGAIVVAEKRQGYGAAYKTGLRRATGDIIIAMDGDGTYPRNFIPILLDVMIDEGFDFITCDRTGHKDKRSNWLRVFGNDVLNWFILLIYWVRVRDSQSGMWVFRRSILQYLNLTSDGMAFSEEIKLEAMSKKKLVRSKELPIYYKERHGASKLHIWRDGLSNLLFLFRKRFGMLGTAPPLVEPRELNLQKEPNA